MHSQVQWQWDTAPNFCPNAKAHAQPPRNECHISLEIGMPRPVHSELNQPQASRCYDTASFLPMARLRSMSRARTSQDC